MEARMAVDPKHLAAQIPPDGRCTAKSRQSGERCKRRVSLGYTVCHFHGGKTPQARRKAQLRLLSLVEPALATMAQILANSDSEALRLKAAENILDRGGFPRGVQVSNDDAREMLIHKLLEYRRTAGIDSGPFEIEGKVIDAQDD